MIATIGAILLGYSIGGLLSRSCSCGCMGLKHGRLSRWRHRAFVQEDIGEQFEAYMRGERK